MRLRLDLAVSVPKDPERQDLNEDTWALNETGTRVSVCDGASESFDSRAWARLLADRYAGNSTFTPESVGEALQQYLSTVDYDAFSWSKQAAFDRGSFATLLGLNLVQERSEVEVLAIGDSVAFLLAEGVIVASFPYTTPEEFDARPELLSTIPANNTFVGAPQFLSGKAYSSWELRVGNVLLLATDAVAHWALRERDQDPSALHQLAAISDQSAFEQLVSLLRSQHRIRIDDSTLLRIVVEE